MLSLAVPVLLLVLQGSRVRPVLREDFDEPGTSWAPTLFPDVYLVGSTTFTREPLSASLGAPDTLPPLPINAGGDLEGRFAVTNRLGGGSFALRPDTPENQLADGAVRGYVAIGVPDPFGGQTVGFLLRASIDPHPLFGSGLDAYTTEVVHNSGDPFVTLVLARWRGGVITASDVFASGTFPFDPGHENYLLEFRAEGEILSARLWRVTAVAGSLLVEPVLLGTSGGPASLLSARDPELAAGRAGVSAFTAGGNSVFWDELELGRPADRLGHLVQPPGPPLSPRRAGRRP